MDTHGTCADVPVRGHRQKLIDKSERGYDLVSPYYHWIEWLVFGNQLQHARTCLLSELPNWERMLIFGDGDGRLLESLLQAPTVDKASTQSVTSVDQSGAMISSQKSRMNALNTPVDVRWMQTNALTFTPDENAFDVLVMPFFLDCFTSRELDEAIPRWLSGLRPGGHLYYVDFVMPQSGWRRWRAQVLSISMHSFFRVVTGLSNRQLIDPTQHLRDAGLRPHLSRASGYEMLETTLFRKYPVY